MEKAFNILEERMTEVKIIADNSAKYVDSIKNIINSMNPKEYSDAIDSITFLNEVVDSILKIKLIGKRSEILQKAFELYQLFNQLESNIVFLLSIFENNVYAKMALYNMSATYAMNILHDKNTVITAYEKYQSLSIPNDEEIINLVFKMVPITDKPEQFIPWIIEKKQTVNLFTIKLISSVIDLVSGDFRRQLELVIEDQKDSLLGAQRKVLSFVGTQEILVRYNLTPITNSMPINKLFEELEISYDDEISLEENFNHIVEKNIGVIVINRSSPTAVEFDLRGLIDLNYVIKHDLKTNQQSGLTKKITRLGRGIPTNPNRLH